MNLDFSTLCLISVPGFLVGLMAGRFVSCGWFRDAKNRLGALGRLLGGIFFSAYVIAAVVTLGIMIIYLVNFPETAKPVNFWLTTLLGLWISLNLLFDCRQVLKGRNAVK